jgi:ankyrin repeat protein
LIEERMNNIDQELIWATSENNLLEVRRLLSVGADVNAEGEDGWTALFVACYDRHLQLVKELLEHGADVDAKDFAGATPLHNAVRMGHLAVANELLEHGAQLEAKDADGLTALHYASSGGHVAMVPALLSRGANTLATSEAGLLPVHYALSEGHSTVSKCLLLQLYATTRRLPLHELLKDLTWKGNPDSINAPLLRTALDWNVLGMDDVVEIVEYVVGQNPALLCSRDQDNSLPLHVACRRGAPFAIVQFLVNRYKASVKSVTPQGDLALFLACERPEPSLDTIFLLMKLYPDLVYESERENTGLRRSGRDRRAPVRFS